jgi:hypothetical protein
MCSFSGILSQLSDTYQTLSVATEIMGITKECEKAVERLKRKKARHHEHEGYQKAVKNFLNLEH